MMQLRQPFCKSQDGIAVYTWITHGQIQDRRHPRAKSSTDVKYCLELLISSYFLQITQKEKWYSSSLTRVFQMCAQHILPQALTLVYPQNVSITDRLYWAYSLCFKLVYTLVRFFFFFSARFCELPQKYAQKHM